MPEIVVSTAVTGAGSGHLWGLEGRHRWNDAITLNDNEVFPRYRCRKITGLASLADAEDKRDNAVGSLGENIRRSRRRGKTVSYEGVIEALSLGDLRAAERDLRAAFFDQETEKRMEITPHPSYDSGSRYYLARALDVTIDDEQGSPLGVSQGYSRPFAVAVRQSNPRYFDGVAGTASTGPFVPGGGAALPLTPPFTLPGSDVAAGSVTADVNGTAGADLTVTIFGPITDPVVHNITRDLHVGLEGVTLGGDDFVVLDFNPPRRILLGGVIDASYALDQSNASWWDEDPGLTQGTQTFQLTGAGSGAAHADFVWHDAYW